MRRDLSLWHWHVASCFGFLACGRFVPLCAFVGLLGDSRARRVYCRAMERAFAEPRHVEHITAAWVVGSAMRAEMRNPRDT